MAGESKKMTRNTLIFMPAKILEGVLLLAMSALYTKWFIPSVYNVYQLANTTVLLLFLITSAWLYNAAARFVADYKTDDEKKTFYSTFVISFSVIALAVIAMGAVIWQVTGNFLYLAGSIMLCSYSLFTIMNGMLVQTEKIAASVCVSLLSVSGKILCAVALMRTVSDGDATVYPMIFAAILSDIIVSIGAMVVLKIPQYTRIKAFSKRLLSDLLTFGVPLIGMSIGVGLLSMIDRYIVTWVMGDEVSAAYIANYAISSGIFGMISAAAVRATYPSLISGYAHGGRTEAENLLSHGIRLYLLIALPAALGLCAVCKPLAGFMFVRPLYHTGAIVMGIAALAYFVMGLTEYAIKGYELTKKTKPVLIFSLIAAAIKIAATFALIPLFGIAGAAYGTLIAFTAYFLMVIIFMHPIFTFRVNKKSTLNIIFSSVMCFAAAFLGVKFLPFGDLLTLILSVAFGGIAYIICIALTGEVKEEISSVKTAISSRKNVTK